MLLCTFFFVNANQNVIKSLVNGQSVSLSSHIHVHNVTLGCESVLVPGNEGPGVRLGPGTNWGARVEKRGVTLMGGGVYIETIFLVA